MTAESTASLACLLFDFSHYSIDNMFVIRVEEGRFYLHWANQSLVNAGGLPLEQIRGKTPVEVLGAAAGEICEAHYRDCLLAREPIEYEEQSIDAEGKVHYWHTLLQPRVTVEGDIPFICGISRNITALVMAKQEVETANRVKADFLAKMSHELRSALNSVVTVTSFLNDTGLQETQQRYINIIQSASNAILNIVNDISEYSKIAAGSLRLSPCYFNIGILLQKTCESMAVFAAEKGLLFEQKIDPQLINTDICSDSARIRQVLVNLLSNAIKYTIAGYVRLEANIEKRAELFYLKVMVADSGIGVDPEEVANLFKPFSRLRNATEYEICGTGLGLNICREIADILGGTIKVNSELNKGSTFTLTLPLADMRTSPGAPPDVHFLRFEQGKGRLLLAEDDKTSRMIMSELLRRYGYTVVAVDNGQQLLDELLRAEYDLVLLDWEMPEVNGIEAALRIRRGDVEGRRHIPIIGITGRDSASDQDKCIEAGMNVVVTKPVNIGLVNTVDLLLEPNRGISPLP